MKTLFLAATMLLSSAFGETFEGHLMPSKCKSDDPKTHNRECALACQSSGFGVMTAKGEYVSFNEEGNAKALEMLKASSKTSDLRVTVEGSRSGAVLKVESIKWR